MEKMHLLDRQQITGEYDQFVKEGLSYSMGDEPKPLAIQMDRNPELVAIEDAHAALYRSDRELMHWKRVAEQAGDRYFRSGESAQYSFDNLSKEEKTALAASPDRQEAWLMEDFACRAVDRTEEYFNRKKGMAPLNLTFWPPIGFDPSTKPKWVEPPFDIRSAWASFPMDGQFAFSAEESAERKGYVVFPHNFRQRIWEDNSLRDAVLKARWTRAADRAKACSEAILVDNYDAGDAPLKLNFMLPTAFLTPGDLFWLEIVAAPGSPAPAETDGRADCARKLFAPPPPPDTATSFAGERLLTELFFRNSLHSLRERIASLGSKIDWKTGILRFKTDEPFTPAELREGPRQSWPLMLSIEPSEELEKASKDPLTCYFLAAPRTEDLASRPLDDLAPGEQDGSFEAFFAKKTDARAAAEYLKLPPNFGQGADFALPGGRYAVPSLPVEFLPDSVAIVGGPIDLFIDRADFEANRQPLKKPVECVLFIGELVKMARAATLCREQVGRRLEERAVFFHQIQSRRARREGRPVPMSLDDVRKKELEAMPPKARWLLDLDLAKQMKTEDEEDFRIYVSRFFPGTHERTASLTVVPKI